MEKGSHRHETLARLYRRHRAFTPENRQHFLIGTAAFNGSLVVDVLITHGSDLAQYAESLLPKIWVLLYHLVYPFIDLGGSAHIVRGKTAHESHVQYR